MADATWKPTRQDYLDALVGQNPWQHLGRVPESLRFTRLRPLAQELWRTMIGPPARYQVVLGPRRVGKTVSMYQSIQRLIDEGVPVQRLWFMRLDHPLFMDFGLDRWVRSLMVREKPTVELPLFLFLDEVNYAQQWDKWLKTFYDERWPVRVVATSSSTAALRGRTVESGIGRWAEQFLTPYTFAEFLDLRGVPIPSVGAHGSLFDALRVAVGLKYDAPTLNRWLDVFLLIGGFPELLSAFNADDMQSELIRSQQVLRSEAVQRVTGMDIPQVFDVRDPLTLERLLYILAGQMCGQMNTANLAQITEKSRPTVQQYVHYLEMAYLIFTLPNYAKTEEQVQRRGRKVYFLDGAVRNAALQRGLAPSTDPAERGFLVENAAASHLNTLALQRGTRLYHWRDGSEEVDLIYDDADGPIAFEITASARHHRRGLLALQRRFPVFRGRSFLVSAATTSTVEPSEDADGIGTLPLYAMLLAVGSQAHASLRTRLGLT